MTRKFEKAELPRMTRKFKKARLRWTEDGRRVYIDENGEEINPFEGQMQCDTVRLSRYLR